MVEDETKRYKQTKNYLEHLTPLNTHEFETDLIRNEIERLQNRQPMEMLNMKRYELPSPSTGKTTDVASWNECVENSMAQLEHQATRIANLDLMAIYGTEAWKTYNTVLSQMVQQAQKRLQELKKQIQEIHWQRKNDQTGAGEKLKRLEENWVGLVSKNYEIERVCVELEYEIFEMQKQIQPDSSTENVAVEQSA